MIDGTSAAALPRLKVSGARAVRALRHAAAEHRRLLVMSVQLCTIVVSSYLAFSLRFDGAIPDLYWTIFIETLPALLAIRGIFFFAFRLHAGSWKYTGISDLCSIIMAVASSSVVTYVIVSSLFAIGYSRSILLIDSLLLVVLLSGIRLVMRAIRLLLRKNGGRRVLIYGAGDAGEMIARDMRHRPYGYEPIGFIDDDPNKLGQRIHGVPVLGGREELGRIISTTRPHEVLVAIPSADPSKMREVVKFLESFDVPISTLPSVRDILGGRIAVNQIRQLTIADLLPRAPVDLDADAVRRLIGGSRVLVTGAGGSIGGELSRQIAAFSPASLVLYERYENTLHDLVIDLADRFGLVSVLPVIGDVTDARRVHQVMDQYRPQIVFHAAAHKHVPLMEHNPCEAVKNNVVGTSTVAKAAELCGVERFILISTDKAVNPSSVMGATKAVCELIVHAMSAQSPTQFTTVRFGNVLGSNGSVLLRFLDQVKAGGPVTVTHPEIRRFFMLIPEAVQLVLHAATLGDRGMTYVLDMGEQIKLVDLARNLIRLTGFVPDKEIPISFIGLRPGEKLFEELIGNGETPIPSNVPNVLSIRRGRLLDHDLFESQLSALIDAAVSGDSAGVAGQLRGILPDFNPAEEQRATSEMPEASYALRTVARAPDTATLLPSLPR